VVSDKRVKGARQRKEKEFTPDRTLTYNREVWRGRHYICGRELGHLNEFKKERKGAKIA